MLRNLRSRRRPRYGAHVCAVISALLLLFSVSLLHTRLSSSPHTHSHLHSQSDTFSTIHQNDADSIANQNPLLSDSVDISNDDAVDKIDELDTFDDQNDGTGSKNDNEELEGELENDQTQIKKAVSSSGYYVDHITGSIRRALNKRSIDEWDSDYNSFSVGLNTEDKSLAAFGSDDMPIDEEVRRKVHEVKGIEDALLLKSGKIVSPLREGWGDWFDKKGDFLRRDRMFKSNFEALNPLNNPLLHDPDGIGATGLTRGDKAVQKLLLNEFKKIPFPVKKHLKVLVMNEEEKVKENSGEIGIRKGGEMGNIENVSGKENNGVLDSRSEMKRAERRTLDENASNESFSKRLNTADENLSSRGDGNALNKDDGSNAMQDVNPRNASHGEVVKDYYGDLNSSAKGDLNSSAKGDSSNDSGTGGELRQKVGMDKRESRAQQRKSEELSHVFADGKRWGFYPGLHPHLSFSGFMDSFFRKGKCDLRVFMVWNSPPWMYSVRHQRGLESLLSHHRDACVVVLSETIELDFFKDSFVKDGYKVAVAMPNLDELLKDTPTHVFASVWFQWRKTKFYPTHYSELVRLAALYKYGGLYLDSDVIVLNPLSSLNNTVGLEDQIAGSSLNGAVMSFRQQSPFIMDCLKEFYMTYDDTRLRWNGADLLTRVARNYLSKENKSIRQLEFKVQLAYSFFPIGLQDITSFFAAPASENEKAEQDAFLNKILSDSLTFHFWNSLTAALIPEPDSLVARLIDHHCIRCSDVL